MSRLAGDWALRVRSQPPEPPNLVDKEIGVLTPAGGRHQMILIPEGEFTMGTDTGAPNEGPVHTVFLDAYRIDKVEVSYAHYVAFLNAVGRTTDEEGDEMIALGLSGMLQIRQTKDGTFELTSSQVVDHPVFDVTWHGAKAYCEWMGGRLPTEAEWEKAARGPAGRTYPWGNEEPNASLLNFDANLGGTTPVVRYPSGKSPYGVLDMAGNVWEWVQDRYSSRYYAESPKRNPQGPDTGNIHIIRGGSWDDDALSMRTTLRFLVGSAYADPDLGFRCARRP